MQHSKIEAITSLIVITVFIFVMITFIIKILFFAKIKEEKYTLDLLAVKANYDRELFKAQLEIQEQTSLENAREIHDNVGQTLALAKLRVETLDPDGKIAEKESILEVSDYIEKALDDLRHISRMMNPDIIKNRGLQKSIEMQVAFLQRGGKYNIHMTVNGDQVRFDKTKEIILFRIVQEAINNIIRHSTATDISLSLSYEKDFLQLLVRDNGKGFDVSDQSMGPGSISGIYNMQQRANLVGAEFQLDSKIGCGTGIMVTTPY
jgi:two-component system, NarL family, sensor kinase